MYIYCCLKCTPAPFTAVLEHAGTCPFTENKKHAENIGNRYCTPLSIEDVLVYPSHIYVHDTPYTCTFLKNPNFADKYSLTVLYSSCYLRCTPAPFTTVLDTAGTCLFTENKKHSENIGKHYCTPLVSEAVFVHPSAVYSTHLTPVPSCRTQILQTKIGKHFL
jgi:hypothetical protein